MTADSTAVGLRERRGRAIEYAGWSLLVPGLGQLVQRRYGTALLQFGTVVVYLAGTLGLGGRRSLLFALFWTVWSVVDAYRHEAE
jgi:hypothetical protein